MFQEELARLRSRIGITQSQLADRVGVSVRTVKRWEGGYAPRRRSQVERLGPALSLTMDERRRLMSLAASSNEALAIRRELW